MKIATWNVNSIRVRLPRVVAWLAQHQPDVVCLQETKAVDEQFPFAELQAVGYHAATWGQKTYNGVALLSKVPGTALTRGFTDAEPAPGGEQARCIAATFGDLRVISVYVPNGSEIGSEKYLYKLQGLAHLSSWLQAQQAAWPQLVLCGDMNVAPSDADVHDPLAWADSILCSPPERAAFSTVTTGMIDLVRQHNPQPGLFTWWDYRGLSFFKNLGLRIDHIYGTSTVAQRCTASSVDRAQRKGEQPSDHAPVLCEVTPAAP